MGKKQASFRTTISVPHDLKERMDKAGEQVNWSAVACRAFEDKLAEIASKRTNKTMNDVVQRLRASRNRAESKQYRAGDEAGRQWVKDSAEANELDNLSRAFDRCGTDWGRMFDGDDGSAYSAAETVYFWLHPEEEWDRRAAAAFWDYPDGSADDPTFVKGFCEGALELWGEIESKL